MSATATDTFQVDPPSGARLVGGDLLHWSDLQRTEPCSALGYLVAQVIRAQRPGRVLLLGPRAASLLDVIATPSVSVLVRGLPDARTVASLARERDELAVYCGGIDRFVTEETFDLVVSLDGPGQLLTPDSPGGDTAAVLQQVSSYVAPGGHAIVAVDNTIGLDDVFRLDLRTQYDDDSQWFRGAPGFEQRAPYRHEVAGLLADAGLHLEREYCGYASAAAPVLLVDVAVTTESRSARDEDSIATLAALLTHAEATHFSRTPALVDPYVAARRIVAAGLVAELAPEWIVIARATPVSALAEPEPVELPAALPQIVLGDDFAAAEWSAVLTLNRTTEGWERGASTALGRDQLAERRLARDVTALRTAYLTPGRPLEGQLRQAAAQGDITRLRRLVRAYCDWLAGAAAPGVGQRFFATPDNVVVDAAGTHTLLDPSWAWSETLDPTLCVVRGLRVFARRLLRSGAEHPWRPDISPDALTQTLASMADLVPTPEQISAIALREAELDAVLQRLSEVQESQTFATNLASGASQFTATPGPSRGYRESLSLTGRMSQELHERGEQVQWLESSLRDRDQRVATLERELASVRSSASYQAGRKLTSPGRRASEAMARAGRKGALSMLPPDFQVRAERALRRLLDQR